MTMRDVFTFRPEDPYEYFFVLGKNWYPAREVRGREGLSLPFRFEMRFRFQRDEFAPPDELVGDEGSLVVSRGGIVLRRLKGVVSDCSVSATANGNPELMLVLEPRLALMREQSDYRVFRNKTVPEIVVEVLEAQGVTTALRLRDTYKRRPYTVMYDETLLDFVHRLLEDEGIFYLPGEVLEDDADDAVDVILGDGIHAYEPLEGDDEILFKSTAGLQRPEEGIFDVSRAAKMRPGKVSLRDWNLESPSAPMDVSADLPKYDEDTIHGPEYYDYPGKYELPTEGQRKARLFAEAFACASMRIRGRCDTARLMIGRTLKLIPDEAFAAQGIQMEELTIVALDHAYRRASEDGAQGGTKVDVRLEALPMGVTFRPERKTPAPMITNPITGVVTGPSGEDIYCDELGRVKVLMQWDRYQPPDENCSHWIPVLQDNTGTSSAIPRIGWEVVVAFVDGDPDRPFVLGRVYNAADVFPEALPAGKTKSALRSLSSPGRDGHNEIWLEDAAGRELMSLQAEKDQNVVVANDKRESVGNIEENSVVLDETIVIGNNNTVTIAKQQVLAVDGNQSISVGGSRSRKVAGAEQSTVAGSKSTTVGGSHIRKIGGFDNAALAKSLKESTGGVEIEASLKENSTNAELLQTLTVGGAVVEVAGQGKEEKSEMIRLETIGALLVTNAKTNIDMKAVVKRATTVMSNLTATITDSIQLVADKVFKGSVQTGAVTGKTVINITVGDNIVVIDANGVTMSSKKNIEITATGKNDLVGDEVSLN
ncbi:MAG: type VI secretion system tip protein VgrG [Polyangiaceae bacterium]|jgi:type VI secretion system secreted protein VgrG|nr:type VI secretion system tip protein VgrG [Polyangiaceae bacterium]MBK8943058.1 type VI secretion system tip protein VgrG [Polyangiaceae bacterium]